MNSRANLQSSAFSSEDEAASALINPQSRLGKTTQRGLYHCLFQHWEHLSFSNSPLVSHSPWEILSREAASR